ncbi:MAG: YggT family protein [Deferribacteraceae bacterium]|jgi:YggT family protein|nr:YggT family protein [Deferribacteraceae bacterium]
MSTISFLFKAYIAVLFLRWIMTRQELNFNFIGRGVAKITDPILDKKGKLKSETDRFIPLVIALIILLYGVILRLFIKYTWDVAITAAFKEMTLFIALFFVVCVLLGSMATPSAGILPLFFYRLGNICVNPVRKVMPLRGNMIIIPALLFIAFLFVVANTALTYITLILNPSPFNIIPVNMPKMAAASAVVFAMGLTTIIFGLIVVIIVRALISWVSPSPGNIIVQLIYYITEPALAPMRRIVPPLGILDLSALVTIVLLSFMNRGIIAFLNMIANNAGLYIYML